MERHLDAELQGLKSSVLHMGGVVERMIQLAIQELTERNSALAQEVAVLEPLVNQMHIDIDEHCIRLLALFQPEAADLRFITATMKIISDLERIGDQAVNVSQTSLIMIDQPRLQQKLSYIPKLSTHALKMLKDGLDAFVNQDVRLAETVLRKDDDADRLKNQTFQEMLQLMLEDSSCIRQALELILISRNLEKIGDHATNVAEDVIYMVLGKDVRHRREDPDRKALN